MESRRLRAGSIAALGVATLILCAAAAAPATIDERSSTVALAKQYSVDVSKVNSTTPYVTWTVPECVDTVAYIVSGGSGGGTRPVGTAQHADGGAGTAQSGALKVAPGEQLRLYPASQGAGAILSGSTGDAGGGGSIGFARGGGGSGTDSGGFLGGVRGNPGGGGGAAGAIALGSAPLVVAAGGGGAGGSNWDGTPQRATPGGSGGQNGGVGLSNPAPAAVSGAMASSAGSLAANPAGNIQGGGGGGGGGGYRGGAAGAPGANTYQAGGSGAGGSNFVDPARQTAVALDDFGLTAPATGNIGDGTVTIAWHPCVGTVTITGSTTDATGAASSVAGWGYSTSTASMFPSAASLDASGSATFSVGYVTGASSRTVQITQAARSGWPINNWSGGTIDGPLASCTLGDATATPVQVTTIDANTFAVDVPAGASITCRIANIEAAPRLAATGELQDLDGTPLGTSAVAGTSIRQVFTVTNTGNVPVTELQAADTRAPAPTCGSSALLPQHSTTCVRELTVQRTDL